MRGCPSSQEQYFSTDYWTCNTGICTCTYYMLVLQHTTQPCFRNLSFYFTSGLKLSSSHTRAATAYTHRHEGKGESVQSLVWQRVNSDGLEMLRLSLLSGMFGHKKLLIIYDEEQVSKSQLSEAHRMRVHVHVPVIAKRNTTARRLSYHHHRFILAKCQLSTCNTMLSGFPYSSDFPKNCELPLI